MKKIALAALVLSTTSGCFSGCNKKKEAEAIEPAPPTPVEPESGSGKPLTGAQLGQRVIDCWGYYNDGKWDDYKGCYTADATYDDPAVVAAGLGKPLVGIDKIVDSEKHSKDGTPDVKGDVRLVLVHGHDVVDLAAATGTHTGPIAGVTEMNQKVGMLVGNVDVMDDHGRESHESDYGDDATTKYQLVPDKAHPVRPADHLPEVPKDVVVGKDDAAEQANVAVVKQLMDGFNKHDAKAMGAALADGVVWSEQENPKDWTKAEVLTDAQAGWKSFSDMKMTPTAIWGAGDYVVVLATMEGTNNAPAPEMGIKTATKKKVTLPFLEVDKLEAGKVTNAWVLAQSGVVPIAARARAATGGRQRRRLGYEIAPVTVANSKPRSRSAGTASLTASSVP